MSNPTKDAPAPAPAIPEPTEQDYRVLIYLDEMLKDWSNVWSITALIRLLAAARRENETLRREVERLKSGQLTAEETHNLCHNLGSGVTVEEFNAGCSAYQKQLYGCSMIDKITAERDDLRRRCEAMEAAGKGLATMLRCYCHNNNGKLCHVCELMDAWDAARQDQNDALRRRVAEGEGLLCQAKTG